jgi:hypothetical protein
MVASWTLFIISSSSADAKKKRMKNTLQITELSWADELLPPSLLQGENFMYG